MSYHRHEVQVVRLRLKLAHRGGPHPAAIMGLEAGVVRTGAKANLIICEGHTFDEVLSLPQSRRIVLRDGRPIDTAPPDYRELDDLF